MENAVDPSCLKDVSYFYVETATLIASGFLQLIQVIHNLIYKSLQG